MRTLKNRRFIFFIFILFLLMTGCLPKPAPRVAVSHEEGQIVLASVRKYLENLQDLKGVRGYARVGLKLRGHSLKTEEVVTIRLPREFRFETVDDFGNVHFVLDSDGDFLSWEDRTRMEFDRIPLTEEELSKWIPLGPSIEETLGMLLGRLPFLDFTNAQISVQEGLSKRYVIDLLDGEVVWSPSDKAVLSLSLKGPRGEKYFVYSASRFEKKTISSAEWVLPRNIAMIDYRSDKKDKRGRRSFPREIKVEYLQWQPLR